MSLTAPALLREKQRNRNMEANQRNKARALSLWQALDNAPQDAMGYLTHLQSWQGPEPFGVMHGAEAVIETMFARLRWAIPNLTRNVHLFLGGVSDARQAGGGDGTAWVAGTGYYTGRAVKRVFGIPATDTDLRIRWADFVQFDKNDNIIHVQTIWDFVDWFDQIRLPVLPRPLGAAHVFPAATGYDGVLSAPQDTDQTHKTLALGRELIFGGLNSFDERDLGSMGMARFFHSNLKWYGPGGIGACLSLKEFETSHQEPWLIAFPDRKVTHLESLFAEGRLLAASGPKGVTATHKGPYLGHPASGNPVEVSGIDFWLRSGNRFTENWVFVDMIHLFSQMGVDLFDRLTHREQKT